MIGGSLDRLGAMGKEIHAELRQQGHDLDAFHEEVDDASSKMADAMLLMKKMLKQKDRGKLCCIVILTIVLIVLIWIVVAW